MKVDLNCDLGEGIGNDEAIMPFITSANIACGYHAGDIPTIQQTIENCIKHKVAIGVHPSFYDRENFGRKEINLPVDEIYELIFQQLLIFKEVADSMGQKMNHVKPHGALYNLSAKDAATANTIAKAVKDFDPTLVLYGLSGSHSINEAIFMNLNTLSEVFADRTYQDNGSLTPRTSAGALITDVKKSESQVKQMIKDGTVTTTSGKSISIKAETICIHGDGVHAIQFAKAIHKAIK